MHASQCTRDRSDLSTYRHSSHSSSIDPNMEKMAALNSVNSTLATIADAIIGINGTTNLTNVANNETEHHLRPIDGTDIFYEGSFLAHLFGSLYLLFKTVSERKCEGFSYKTQFILLLSSFLRFTNIEEAKGMVLFVPKITQLFVDVAAFVAVCIFKSKKTDRFEQIRIGLLIAGCMYMCQVKMDTSIRAVVTTQCLMFDAVALLPQYILVEKMGYLSKLGVRFVHCHLVSQIMYSFHLYRIYCYGYGIAKYEPICREMLSRLCIIVIGMLIFLNYMNAMIKGYECHLKIALDSLEANHGHAEDCPQKDYPLIFAITEDVYNRNKTVEEEEESK